MNVQLPEGWVPTQDKKRQAAIMMRLVVTGGHCPCLRQDQWSTDSICPCKMFREGNGCECGLYVQGGHA